MCFMVHLCWDYAMPYFFTIILLMFEKLISIFLCLCDAYFAGAFPDDREACLWQAISRLDLAVNLIEKHEIASQRALAMTYI
jgi:hypothetical protein